MEISMVRLDGRRLTAGICATLLAACGADGGGLEQPAADAAVADAQGFDIGESPPPIVIRSFTATSSTVARFESAELHWDVSGARVVEISLGEEVLSSSFSETGSLVTRPITESTVF